MTALTPTGLLLPESVLASSWFTVLSVFVAINTVMYVALAVGKTLPKADVRALLPRRYVRSRTRSIHPVHTDPASADSASADPASADSASADSANG